MVILRGPRAHVVYAELKGAGLGRRPGRGRNMRQRTRALEAGESSLIGKG